MDSPNPKRWFTLKEACVELDLTVREFRRYISLGLFPRGIRTPGGKQMRWTPADIEHMHYTDVHNRRYRPDKPSKVPKEP